MRLIVRTIANAQRLTCAIHSHFRGSEEKLPEQKSHHPPRDYPTRQIVKDIKCASLWMSIGI